MRLIDDIELELELISRWPWEVGTAGNANIVHFDGDDIRGVEQVSEKNREFIAKAPERIAALVEYVKAADAYMEKIAPDSDGKTLIIDAETAEKLFAARRKLGLE